MQLSEVYLNLVLVKVETAIENLKIYKSSGIDEIPAGMI
jgi:hypothetical protein